MDTHKPLFLPIGGLGLLLTILGDLFYRPWVYKNNIDDFGFVYIYPSITGTITSIFLLLAFAKGNPTYILKCAGGGVVGCLIYECIQPIVGTGVFDINDFIAVFVTGILCCLVIGYWKNNL
jgi:hypothetical protein